MALHLHIPIGDLKLVSSSPADIHANPGEDVTLPCHLSLETSVVTMELKWLKRTDCIYLNKNGQGTEGRDYESRVSVLTEDLQKGNVSLRLRDITHSDNGLFRCQVIHGNCKLEETLLQHVESIQNGKIRLMRTNSANVGYRPNFMGHRTGETPPVCRPVSDRRQVLLRSNNVGRRLQKTSWKRRRSSG
ncbi:butyrophilin subfamily 3 member A1 [Clupea harengus]|uniref:Butyrophilin subfamily 3 member A1 n=1 Tax=Clupea harengus TaxID=7950 RepID=A0A6P8EZC1_CLUHA|nr:butyrophilin subfamily 3 member A1 [Clupea harengus]